jgi:hypothetical protein
MTKIPDNYVWKKSQLVWYRGYKHEAYNSDGIYLYIHWFDFSTKKVLLAECNFVSMHENNMTPRLLNIGDVVKYDNKYYRHADKDLQERIITAASMTDGYALEDCCWFDRCELIFIRKADKKSIERAVQLAAITE